MSTNMYFTYIFEIIVLNDVMRDSKLKIIVFYGLIFDGSIPFATIVQASTNQRPLF